MGYVPSDYSGPPPGDYGVTCRVYNYSGYPDSFFEEVCALMGWKWQTITNQADSIYKVLAVHSGITSWFRGDVKELNRHLEVGWKIIRVDACNEALLYLLIK